MPGFPRKPSFSGVVVVLGPDAEGGPAGGERKDLRQNPAGLSRGVRPIRNILSFL